MNINPDTYRDTAQLSNKGQRERMFKTKPRDKRTGPFGGTSFLLQTLTGWTVGIFVSHGKAALFGSNLKLK